MLSLFKSRKLLFFHKHNDLFRFTTTTNERTVLLCLESKDPSILLAIIVFTNVREDVFLSRYYFSNVHLTSKRLKNIWSP